MSVWRMETSDDLIVIKTTWEKGSTTETPMPPTSTPQFEKEVLDISNNTDLVRNYDRLINPFLKQKYISEFFKLSLHPNWR